MLTTLWKITLGAGSILKSSANFLGNKISSLFGKAPVVSLIIIANILISLFCNSGYKGLEDPYLHLIWASFSHANISHLAGNMLLLALCGAKVEEVLGSRRFLTLYIWSVIGALLGYFLFLDSGRYLGASGAILGIVAVFPFIQRKMLNTLVVGVIVLVSFYLDFMGILETVVSLVQTGGTLGIAYSAHVAGGVSGLITYCFFNRKTE